MIEGAAIILRREHLDRRWPGGATGLIEEFDEDPFTVSADDDLVAIGVDDIRGNECLLEMFADYGLAERFCDTWRLLAIVDEEWGPTNPCDWLDFVQTADGSWAWMPERLDLPIISAG